MILIIPEYVFVLDASFPYKAMAKHPNKDIRKALKYAEERGWIFSKSNGHAFGYLRCGNGCRQPVWSTPRNPTNHAKQIRKLVDKCIHNNEGE